MEELKKRLDSLEKRLQALLEHSKHDLDIAKRLQKLVVKDRLPKIPGIELLARHIPGQDLSAEAFDIIPSKDYRELFVVIHWTQNYGLSSVLLQALVNLQSRASVERQPEISVDELFDDLESALKESHPTATYRLSVLRLDLHTLKYELRQEKFPTWLYCERDHDWAFLEKSGTLAPGSRALFLSAQWNPDFKSNDDFYSPLRISEMDAQRPILESMNEIIVRAEAIAKEQSNPCDFSSIALEIDQRKIHLA